MQWNCMKCQEMKLRDCFWYTYCGGAFLINLQPVLKPFIKIHIFENVSWLHWPLYASRQLLVLYGVVHSTIGIISSCKNEKKICQKSKQTRRMWLGPFYNIYTRYRKSLLLAYGVNEKCSALSYLLLSPKASDTHLGPGLLFICLIQTLLNVSNNKIVPTIWKGHRSFV